MKIYDQTRVEGLLNDAKLPAAETWKVEGITFNLPTQDKKRLKKNPMAHWQRRVLDDVIPESPNSDATTKIPFRILRGLTETVTIPRELTEALSGEFAPLLDLFVRETVGKTQVPATFHVIAARAPRRELESRIFSEKTFTLLCRHPDGHLNDALLTRLLERFRKQPHELDLAQQAVLTRLVGDWSDEQNPKIVLGTSSRVTPLFYRPNELLQEDLTTLLDADLSHSDFLELFNQLLYIHLGLYQARLAWQLNPAMALVLKALLDPDSVQEEELVQLEADRHPQHRFEDAIQICVRSARDSDAARKDSPELRSYERMANALNHLHFNLLLLHRVRELAADYLKAKGYEPLVAKEQAQRPSALVRRLQEDEQFHAFMLRAGEVLAVRFCLDQLTPAQSEEMRKKLVSPPPGWSGLQALLEQYQIYNRQTTIRAASTRSQKQGAQVTRSLLAKGEYGLLQLRARLGAWFELGVGLLPLFLLTSIGAQQDRMRLESFWTRLQRYGLNFSEVEREHLLQHLKTMGLYERFSDAGEASYVLNLITRRQED